MSATRITLTGASWVRGARCEDAEIRPLGAADELVLLDACGDPPAEAVTGVLGLALVRLGDVGDVQPDDVRALTLGDREALMLHLRRLSAGHAIEVGAWCDCGERLELTVDVGTVVLDPYEDCAQWHERELAGRTVRFRLPTGGDIEEAARLVAIDPDAAVELVARGCVDGGEDENAGGGLREALADAMRELDPQADLALTAGCPECGAHVQVEVDGGGLVLRELRALAARALEEVHVLASAYHWSEADIVAMGPRRRRYLELLDSPQAEKAWATSY